MPALQPSMYTMTSFEELTKRHITMPLERLRDWKPFQIDALGLVTLLGADEVNQSVGTLHHRRYTEYLPLLAAFVIAGDRFVAEQPGFVLYNLTDGITSTELQGWLTRWIMSQKVNNATTVLEWKPNPKSKKSWRDSVAPILSFILVAPLLVITVLVGDWYGVGNAAAIIISILTRIYLLSQRRHARDKTAGVPKVAKDLEEKNSGKACDADAVAPKDANAEPPKILCIIRSDGKMVTCKVPGSVLDTFVKHSEVSQETFYHVARWICWLALGVHMCILGMCSLFTQIYTVFLLVLSTWWFTSDFPWDIRRQKEENVEHAPGSSVFRLPFNRNWTVEQIDHPRFIDGKASDKRQYAWARQNLDAGAEEALKAWNLFPIDAKNKDWLKNYHALKESLRADEKSAATSTQSADARPRMPTTTQSTEPLVGRISPPVAPESSPSQKSASDLSIISSPDDTPRVPAGD